MRYAIAFVAGGIAATLVFMSPSGMVQAMTKVAPDSSQYVRGSLCKRPDQALLSCSLAKNGKIVSMCAAGSAAPYAFYYVFGRPNAVEMHYPVDPSVSNNDDFSRTTLGYSQGMAGYAYSFVNNGIKYIVYTISGKFGYEHSGVMVQKPGNARALADMVCRKGNFRDTSDNSLIDDVLKMKRDADLDVHGLPLTN
jgi:hypothetical protein